MRDRQTGVQGCFWGDKIAVFPGTDTEAIVNRVSLEIPLKRAEVFGHFAEKTEPRQRNRPIDSTHNKLC